MIKNDEEWKKKLTKKEYEILRAKGTERPFTSPLLNEKSKGKYKCKACGAELFSSQKKFDSGTGWPSFDEAIPGSVSFVHDDAYGMNRTEVVCANCGSHLGHVFDDGPTTSGKRYCVNGTCLDLEKEES